MGRLYENALNVRMDDFAAGKEMTEHLIGLGHRRIALIKGHPDHIASGERERGYRAAMAEAGFAGEIRIAQGYFTFRSGLAAAEELLNE